MVSTTSLTPDLNFTIEEMYRSIAAEDNAVARKAEEGVVALVNALKPILKYVCSSNVDGVHVVNICDYPAGGPQVFVGLDVNGNFLRVDLEKRKAPEDTVWHRTPVQNLIDGLQLALEAAQQKREQHLAAVATRTQMLDGIQALIKGTTTVAR